MASSLDRALCDRARKARDPRFDGLFFIGVTSTGIYCRPICPAPFPRPENIVYYPTAAAAAAAGLRPCLRCRPETAPGTPAWNGTSATVSRAMHLIGQGVLMDGSIDALAQRLGVTARHLRRLFQQHLGASPKAIADHQRLLFARKLLMETDMSITQAGLAAGYGSLRRFNAAFRKGAGSTPSQVRRKASGGRRSTSKAFQCRLRLAYRPPYDWARTLAFLGSRAIPGVEQVSEDAYHRSVRLSSTVGTIRVRHALRGHALELWVALNNGADLLRLVQRVRRIFDLDANPRAIAQALGRDPLLATRVQKCPGLRLPGTWDPLEAAVRAVVGQQISVKGALTQLGRLVRLAGIRHESDNGDNGVTHYFPDAGNLAALDWTAVRMPEKRKTTLIQLARQVASGELSLESGPLLSETLGRLTTIAGIGDWTANYIAMRGLGEPDALPAADLGLRKAVATGKRLPTPRQVRVRAEAWRPWRAYATIYLWQGLEER